ncbi:hypothetical protein BOTBODRAFT_241570 [Botryobasidium botryosum FD-172 SS1]|uniref:Autophagy-related protein 13 n=1 Tax=Botryobasidium botryosum (strain FD-172 SS1) TaxID=930990 RepID=A0A067MM70_BOTB1|nr:hypothetical protein BOTBODRAFT_241570 [Botryobasidium botryosum FD-172 SS1]
MATPHPSIPFPSSASASPNTRADQIIYKFFTKLVLCIADARVTGGPNASGSNDLSVSSESREAVAVGAAAVTGDGPGRSNRVPKVDNSTSKPQIKSAPPPLHVSVILLIPTNAHAQGQVLVHRYHADSPGSSDPADAEQQPRLTRISSLPRAILLESHILTLAPNDIAPSASSSEVELPQVYKQSIALFRSLYTLLRTLPAWKLYQRLRRRGAGLGSLGMDVRVRIGPRGGEGQGIAGFDVPLAQDPEANATETFNFPSIPTPLGYACFFFYAQTKRC